MISLTADNLAEFVGSPKALLADSTTARERALMGAMKVAIWAQEAAEAGDPYWRDLWILSANDYLSGDRNC